MQTAVFQNFLMSWVSCIAQGLNLGCILLEHLSICFLSVKILLEHRVLLVQYTVVRLLSVLFVSRQLNKRTKGCSTVIMLKSCHLRLLCAHFTINKLSSTVIIRTK